MQPSPREWDAAVYDRVALPHHDWAAVVLDRLELSGDETVLDAGCGSGTVTEQLLNRLPGGRVVAVDGSAGMLQEARRRLAPSVHQVSFVHADLAQRLPVQPVDAVVSSATFHWIPDHRALFTNLADVLRSRGRLSAQCGGAGNGASVQRALDELGFAGPDPWHFATPEQTEADLSAAGFVGIQTWLTPAPAPIPPQDLEPYLAAVVLGSHLEQLPEAERHAFVRAVAERLPGPEIDYVRLNLVARLP
ncbi:MAG TPA: methyltransferase domain-containing protein [Acidimicrobiales bacterium]|nr:methyltransferase domain-containing protein [Acidimicrobiales bacterium]